MIIFVACVFLASVSGARVHPQVAVITNLLNNDSEILHCYLDSQAGQNKRSDQVILGLRLNKIGEPQLVWAGDAKGQTADPEFRKCVIGVAEKMKFPAPVKANSDIQAKLSFP